MAFASTCVRLTQEQKEYFPIVRIECGKKTCLIYLNEDFEGGETHFPKLNIKIQPRLGKAVVWNNTHEDNRVIEESLHAGLPVLSKSKWIMSIWIREKPFLKNSPP